MEFIDISLILFALLTIILFVKANIEAYSSLRKKEAERYFNGSIVNIEESYKERNYTHGLALVKMIKVHLDLKNKQKCAIQHFFIPNEAIVSCEIWKIILGIVGFLQILEN